MKANDSVATILVERLMLSETPPGVVFFGKIDGLIAPGMLISIPMNNSFSMTCEVSAVQMEDQVTFISVLAEDLEEAEFLVSINLVNERLQFSAISGTSVTNPV